MDLEKAREELKAFYDGIATGRMIENRRIGLDTIKDYTISTMYTFDCGYETAIWKGEGNIIVVERYTDEETALEGHSDWVNLCEEVEPIKLFSVQYEEFEFL